MDKLRSLAKNRFYRYINPTPKTPGLQSFWGPDRSYCRAHVFDSSDIVIEFSLKSLLHIREDLYDSKLASYAIPHHPKTFRGPLHKDEVVITGIFFMREPMCMDKETLKNTINLILADTLGENLGGINLIEVESYIDCQKIIGREVKFR